MKNAFAGIRACVCVLIFNAVLKLGKKAIIDKFTATLYGLILVGAIVTDLSPVTFVLIAALLGITGKVWLAKGGEAK